LANQGQRGFNQNSIKDPPFTLVFCFFSCLILVLLGIFSIMAASTTFNIYYGTLVHSVSLKELEIIQNGVLVIDKETGVIKQLVKNVTNVQDFIKENDLEDAQVSLLNEEERNEDMTNYETNVHSLAL
jgi:hypothetical protein